MSLFQFVANLKPADVWQIHIQRNEVEFVFLRQFQSLFPGGSNQHFATDARQHMHHHHRQRRIVFDDENFRLNNHSAMFLAWFFKDETGQITEQQRTQNLKCFKTKRTVTPVTSSVNTFSSYDWSVPKNSLRDVVTANVVRLLREE